MRTLAVCSQKGGSCKTTSTVSLAAALGELEKKVLVVDLDPQASASSWLGFSEITDLPLRVFTDNTNLSDLVHHTDVAGVELIPSSSYLTQVETLLSDTADRQSIFRRAIERLPGRRWDFVFVDCPPSLGLLTISALVACRETLIPVEASAMGLGGLAGILGLVDQIRERFNPPLKLSAVLPCRVDGRSNVSRDVRAQLEKRFGAKVLPSISENVRLREAWSYSQPITTYAPRSSCAQDYRLAALSLIHPPKRRP